MVPEKHKFLYRHLSSIFGDGPRGVSEYFDDSERSSVNVMWVANSPAPNLCSYSTIGLSDHPLMFRGKEFGNRVEFVGACQSSVVDYPRMLSSLAFCIINTGWFCAPGVIFPDAVTMYGLSKTMSDIYFVPPFLWGGISPIFLEGRKIAWLLAVPISRAEANFAQSAGPDKLEALFEAQRVDIFDIHRPSLK